MPPPQHRDKDWCETIVDRAIERLLDRRGQVQAHAGTLEKAMDWIARTAWQRGRQSALLDARSAAEVAEELGVHRVTLYRRAAAVNAGWRIGNALVYLPEDIERAFGLRPKLTLLPPPPPCETCGVAHMAEEA